jgi:hypothetical protein
MRHISDFLLFLSEKHIFIIDDQISISFGGSILSATAPLIVELLALL